MNLASEVTVYGENPSECGYCKSGEPSGAQSFGVMSPRMSVQDYEALMLRGWRRSGNYLYKPLLHKTCCPAYTIRLQASSFVQSRAHKKVLRKVAQEEQRLGAMISVTTERSCYSEEKFELYRRYQVAVHGDAPEEVTSAGFTRFLVESPLTPCEQHGSFHQLYRLGELLVAVGVVDLLPSGLSSVYCFYDPDQRALALGKYTALKEIDYCRTHHLDFYYMGFYIHSCEKMRYKAEYAPSELLCPATLRWQPMQACTQLLDRFAFSPLDPGLAAQRAALGSSAAPSALQALLPERHAPEDVLKLPLYADSLGHFTLDVLTKRSQDQLRGLLLSWLTHAGTDVAQRIQVTFPS